MHELGVVFSVIDNVKRVAKENDANHINRVTLQIGEVSTVIPKYLEDVWKWAITKHEMLTDCELVIINLICSGDVNAEGRHRYCITFECKRLRNTISGIICTTKFIAITSYEH